MTMPAAAREFMTTPASIGTASALSALSEGELADLVQHLVAAEALLHLEALADAPPLPKTVKKAARFAAYQLKSRGVVAPAESRVVSLSSGPTTADLARAAIALLPGLYGRFWLFLGPLPGVSAIEVEGECHGTLKRVEAIAGVGPSRLAKLIDKIGAAARAQGLNAEPRLVSADLALALIAHLEALIRLPGHPDERGLPATWVNVALWREAAMKLGADASRASSRVALEPVADADRPERLVRSGELMTMALSGAHAPPPWIAEALLTDVIEKGEGHWQAAAATGATGPALDAAGRSLLEEMALAHGDAFYAHPSHSQRVARHLEATADGLFALGHHDEAKTLLVVSDALARREVAPREVALVAAAMRQLVDPELVKKARLHAARGGAS